MTVSTERELTTQEKGWVFDLIDFVHECMEDSSEEVWSNEDIIDRICDAGQRDRARAILDKLQDIGWSKHRAHDVVTGLPFEP